MEHNKVSKVPILYAYIFRNIKLCSMNNLCEYNKFVEGLRKVVYKAPSIVYQKIALEMEEYGLLTRVNHKFIRINNSKAIEKRLNELREYVFPI